MTRGPILLHVLLAVAGLLLGSYGLPVQLQAQHPLELLSNAAIAGDCITTASAMHQFPDGADLNPLIGASPVRLAIGCGAAFGANTFAVRLLKPKWRPFVWSAVLIVESAMILHNGRIIGWHLSF